MVVKSDGARCPCGRRGCMEAYAGRGAMEARARRRVEKGEKTHLFKIMEERGRDRLSSGIWERALERGDKMAQELLEEAVDALGNGVASAVNLLDPEAVVIGGGLGIRLGQPWLEKHPRGDAAAPVRGRQPAGDPAGRARRPRRRARGRPAGRPPRARQGLANGLRDRLRLRSKRRRRAPGRPRRRRRARSAAAARRSRARPPPRRAPSMVPSQQPRKPIGIVTRPGNVSEDGEPCESGPGPHRRAEHDHHDRRDDAERDPGQRARGVEPAPDERQQQRREVRAGGEHERHAHEHGHVEAGADGQRDEDRCRRRRRPRRCARRALALLGAAPEHVRPQVVRDRARRAITRPGRPRGSSRTRRPRTARARCRRRSSRPAAERRASSGAARLPPLPTASAAPAPSTARAPKPMIVTSTVNDAMIAIV